MEEKKPVAQSKAVSKKDRQVAVLQLAKKQGTIVRKEVEAALQVSQATAILILREMVDKGVLVKEGTGKHMRYRVAQNPNEKH